jgi:ABC-2 type transport system permease protein
MRPTLLGLVLAIAGKDWRLFWADRRAALLAFVVPIVLASAFGLIFVRQTESRSGTKLPVAIVVEDDGPLTQQVVLDLLASERLEATLLSRSEAEERLVERRPSVAIVLPNGFEHVKNWTPLANTHRPAVEFLHHPMAAAERQWAIGVLHEIVMHRLAREQFGAVSDSMTPFRTEIVAVSGSTHAVFNAYSHSFSGMTLQYLLFLGMESGLLFLRERQRTSWLRLRAAPVPLGAILVGKGLATAAIAMLVILATFAFGHLAFGVRIHGSWLGFGLLALAASVLSAATGLLVAAIGGSEARARSVSILVILGISMLGGLWLPAFLLPGWLRDIAMSLPTTWAMRGLDAATWQGQGFGGVLGSTAVVAAFALAFLLTAVARLSAAETKRRRGFA